jgi:methyl acetate hydrolase
MRALLRGELDGERVLRPETVELAFSDQLAGVVLPEVMHSAIPELCNDAPSLPVAQSFGPRVLLCRPDPVEGGRDSTLSRT